MTNQLPAPDNISDELGYDAPGSDMSGVQPPPTDPATNQLPYAQPAEVGWLYGEDMTELASSDPIPVANDFGAPSDMGSLNRSDVASSAGFHVVDSFYDMYGNTPGRQQASGSLPPGPSMQGLETGAVSNQGYPNAGASGGIDSMQGLDMGWIPIPLGPQNAGSAGSPVEGPVQHGGSSTGTDE